MSQLHHKRGIDFGATAKGYSFFALMLCLFMMGTSFTSIDYEHSANATIAPHTVQGYFAQDGIFGELNVPMASFGKEDINLQNHKNQLLTKMSNFEKYSHEDIRFSNPMTETNVTVNSVNTKSNFNSNKIQFSDSDKDTPENFDIILN